MKHILFLFALLLALTSAVPSRPVLHLVTNSNQLTEMVYVCMSKTSYAYHSSDGCSGLNRCSHPLKAMSTVEAEKLGKRACQKCY
jgi:hypothetical protein